MTTPPAAPAPSLWTKLAYGFGAVAYGVKENGFSYFLLFFYSQVLQLDAPLVALALTLALICDGIIDPAVGYWSDNFHSKWGRRHPFMYASAVPVAAMYYFLWAPPAGLSEEALFFWLLAFSILIRATITFFETPSTSLAPELSADYNQRSSLLSYRQFFGWTGGNLMTVLMFGAIFPLFVTAAIPNGQFNRESYAFYGAIAAGLIFVSILVSAAGTHSRIAHLKPPPPKRRLTLRLVFKEIFETLGDRSFVSLFIAASLGAIATGLSGALTFYILTFFWGFSPLQIFVLTMGVFLSAVIGGLLAPIISKTMGKKRGAMIVGLVAFLGSPLPIALELFGLLPDDPEFVFWFVFIAGTIDVGLIIAFMALFFSMVADLVEQAELKTGRRAEGLFFSATTFIRKLVQGLGVIVAGAILALAGFQDGATPGEVSQEAIFKLGAYYVPSILALWLGMIAVIAGYKIDRTTHEDNLRKLAEGRSA